LFEAFSRQLLKEGKCVRFQARGESMWPTIQNGEVVRIQPVTPGELCKGEIVLVKGDHGFRLHRLVLADAGRDLFITRGDSSQQDDPPVRGAEILGIAESKQVKVGNRTVPAKFKGIGGRLLRIAARGQHFLERVLAERRNASGKTASLAQHWSKLLGIFALLAICMAVPSAHGQVAVDSANNVAGLLAPGTTTGTYTHTVGTGTNRLLVVVYLMNITNAPGSNIGNITFNGASLTQLGAANNSANTRRAEIWYLLNPPSGTFNGTLVQNNTSATLNVGAVAGIISFTGVDQTVPLGTFTSAGGTAGTYSQMYVNSVVNGMVLDGLATGGDQTITVPGPQVTEWNVNSGGTAAQGFLQGSGSARTGAPSVPLSETFSGTSDWEEVGVSINPTAADIGVATSVGSAVFLGANTTYTITVSNNGPSAANTVNLSDTLAAGMTLVSATPSVGTCNTSANPITCALGNLASGATATVTVVETAAAAGSFANSATVSDSGTPPDPNTGNNTYVAVATVQSAACATVSQAAPGTNLTGTLNTYYPGTASVAAGATSITVGAATGAGSAIAAGNLLLVIQMQDASINDSNSVAYGNGGTGQGFTALNSAGDYEFVTAQSAVGTGGGTVTIKGAGTGGGLVFAYHNSAWSATAGRSTFQVIVVPQYTTASFSAASPPTALAWNGSTGGVLAIDTSSTLTLNGATVSVSGQGFRGGAGMQLSGAAGAVTDYLHAAPGTYTGALKAGTDAPKGEGIAGTPLWVESGGTYLNTGTDYPSGTAGTDGSSARGAPGNAGGGGTDGDPTNNDQNAGGGGGGNGGGGGFGGDSWNSNLSSGGEGGAAFPATINRIAMGGGGGGGTRNNSDGDTQASGGAAGGGIIIIRTYALSGTATLTANGTAAYNGTSNDAGGGGGAGGSIVVLSANGGEGGLTLQAQGGRGGDAWDSDPYSLADRHGPGGGGGGGVVLVSGTPASLSVTGATSGTTLNPGVTYGATAGATGTSVTNASITQSSGTQSGAQCTPDMTLSKSSAGIFTRGLTASYTIPVSNVSPYGPSSGTVTVNDTLPVGLLPTSASGTGWSCAVASQTVSCTDSTVLAAGGTYSSITINANVLQTAPSTVTNIATVSGGGEVNLANDTASNVASVISSADLSVTNTASPDPVAAGGNITYTQVVTNNGPSAADNATLVETIPANTTFVSIAAPSGWNCVGAGPGTTSNEVCTDLNMAGSTAATFSMVVKVNAGTANGTQISDSAAVSSSVSDPVPSNNTSTATTVVGATAGAELTVTNSASPNPVVVGNNITYTQVVTNTGSANATGATFTENTPANTTLVSITPPAGWTCASFPPTCTDASVLAGSSGTFTAIYKVTGGTSITDTATVNATNQAFGANSASATVVVAGAAQADLALTTVGTPPVVFPGNDITYTQTVTNNGPAAASTVTFTEAIPANTTFVSVSAPAGWTCTTTTSVTCTNPSVAAGTSANIAVVVNLASTVLVGSITANSSVSSSVTTDPNSANNSTTVVTPVTPSCDLAVTNSGSPSPVQAGNNITYTQVVTDGGPSNCSTATFTEVIPTNTTFVSLTPVPSGWTCSTPSVGGTGTISCSDPTFAPTSTSTFPVVVKVAAGTAANTIITDTATVATPTTDTNSSNNTATVTIGVASATQADLSVTNSASPNPVAAGSNITYTQTLTNNGPATAGGTVVVLFDQVPANATYVSQTGPAGWTCGVFSSPFYTCSIASLAANTSATFTFTVSVNAATASGTTITDTVTTSAAPTTDPNPNNNSATASVIVADSADLSVTNSVSPVPVQASGTLTYTQVVTNAGPSPATTATFTESTPANTTFTSITAPTGWTCTTPIAGGTGTINCTNPSDATGSGTFTLKLGVNAGTTHGTAINDTVTVASATTDPNSANNTATASDVVAASTDSDLVTTNTAAPTTVAAGSNITYTQTVTNLGPVAATGPVTLTQVTPPNTTFQSITPPTGWTCGTQPVVGGTGTITCTAAGTFATGTPVTFTLKLQVVSGTPSGTYIAETATSSAANIIPGITSNTATATVVVANANSADMAIVKTATPTPTVNEGDPLTYTLTVTNNGPATATNVIVTDPLPSLVDYLSSSSTQGTCSEAGGTVTCLLGSMNSAATATISVVTITTAPGVASNTASVSADQTDPISTNNSSTQSETITYATAVQLMSFIARAANDKNGVSRSVLLWRTGGESHNLGFNVYGEQNGARTRLNSSLIAGSALLMRGALPKHSGKTYAWIDTSANAGNSAYWLEDVDVNGIRTMHGPVSVESASTSSTVNESIPASTLTLDQLSQVTSAATGDSSHPLEKLASLAGPSQSQRQKQFDLAAHPAVKIMVKHEGWYSVTQSDLVKSGLDPNVDPALLHLYAEANEQPIEIIGATSGPGGFGPQASINFYGTAIDTPYSGTRVYWLVAGNTPGARIQQLSPSSGSNQPPASFPFTVEWKPRSTYFAALIAKNGNNFFGPLVSTTPVSQVLQIPHLDTASTIPATLEVVLQGVILGVPHNVAIELNGTAVGNLVFTGQVPGSVSLNLPSGVLIEGNNTLTLTAQAGPYDSSLVDHVNIVYPHKYVADAGELEFSGRAGDELELGGFESAPAVVLDISNPDQPVELTPQVSSDNGKYTFAVQVPWTTTSATAPTRHTLLALAPERISSAAAVRPNHPSHWNSAQAGSEIVMISHENFASSLAPLVQAHQAEGQSSTVVPVTDLYDEFTFGEHSPDAIRDFLQTATKAWTTAPRFLLLSGRASLDPRNYLGFGHLDFVPTKIVPTTSLMTASDDWFSDFTNSGMPTIATGRLPVSTAAEAATVVNKIAAYEGQSTNGPWTLQALMVNDKNDTENFAQDSQMVQSQLPAALQVTDVDLNVLTTDAARQDIVTAIDSGQLLVNYLGHGSEEEWSGSDLFDTTTVPTLTNGSQLPVFLILNCLNGFFQDVYEQPLAVTLELAPNGGAVAVLASSGLNQSPPQVMLDKFVVQNAFSPAQLALGAAVLRAKSQLADPAVRATYILFGDPAMPIKSPAGTASAPAH
jgi:uncharacterized repeat protein (TIGR01451 family)